MKSERALPIDMLGKPPRSTSSGPSRIEQLLAEVSTEERQLVDCDAIDGYTTIEAPTHDDAVAAVGTWKWCGGVKLLPLMRARAAS